MARAFLLIRLTLVLVGGLATAGAASAVGGPSGDAGKKSGNTFNMISTAPVAGTSGIAPSAGVGLSPKSVVSNPYNVPLLQNASSLRSNR